MHSATQGIAIFKEFARNNPAIHWFAIADSGQDIHVPKALVSDSRAVRCLLGGSQDTPLARHSPHLVELYSPLVLDSTWVWIGQKASTTASVSVIATHMKFQQLFDQLVACTQVKLPDSETMFFAFWDPAILGTLIGQLDDLTLHVPGPVLSQAQQSLLTDGLAGWWYWDRSGNLHQLVISRQKNIAVPNSFELDQKQVDDLVEASVPDHLLYYVALNQPHLISDIPPSDRYETVRRALIHGREIGLLAMRDLVDFVCLSLLYKEKMRHDRRIVDLLNMVEIRELEFREALEKLPVI